MSLLAVNVLATVRGIKCNSESSNETEAHITKKKIQIMCNHSYVCSACKYFCVTIIL